MQQITDGTWYFKAFNSLKLIDYLEDLRRLLQVLHNGAVQSFEKRYAKTYLWHTTFTTATTVAICRTGSAAYV